MPEYDHHAFCAGVERSLDGIREHRPPEQRVQHLGQRALHASALAGRECDRDEAARIDA
jgi:hypothetical protein